ncbi:DUF1266 domain-containing protein [Bacteroides heparinolyticus]|uniref:DUF1266 domain-containing protein n=1 Tax=Prevotella heparinolytica TaxID=28113 RepID=UPI003F9EC547
METINSLPFNANPQPGIAGSDKLHALFTGLMAGEQYGFYTNSLICEQEAWEYIEFSDKKCREYFASWEEIGKSYLLGQAVNYPGEKKFRNVIECYCTATRNTESPWMCTPFRRAYFSRSTT